MTAYPFMVTLAQTAQAISPKEAAAAQFATTIVWATSIAIIVSLGLIYFHVRAASRWSMSDALSEETEIAIPLLEPGTQEYLKDSAGNIVKAQQMRASTSRLIALLGTVAIMMLYIGGGLTVLREFALTSKVPEATAELTTFMWSGMVLFAPYIVNKFSDIFSWLKPGPDRKLP